MFTPSMCHMSCVMCHVSCISCQVSIIKFFFGFFSYKVVELIGGRSVINGAYPVQFKYSDKLYYLYLLTLTPPSFPVMLKSGKVYQTKNKKKIIISIFKLLFTRTLVIMFLKFLDPKCLSSITLMCL